MAAERKESSPAAPVVEASALAKTFRDFWHRPKVRALQGIDLSVRRGEIFGLLGPNGAGKSTAIKLMLGLLRPSAGEIRVFGRAPDHVATKSRIGYLPEETHLYRYLSAEETLRFYARLFDMDAKTRRERSWQLLEMVGLQHTGRRMLGEFSKGMGRRLGLAQALINDPELIILDEPTSGLDPLGTRRVKDLILALAQRGRTVILSSHLLADVEDICDRIAILYNGRVFAEGTTRSLLESSAKQRVTFPDTSFAGLQRICEAIRSECGHDPDVERPRQSLEAFFIGVVNEARAAEGLPSGAATDGPIPPFLAPLNHDHQPS